jgi:hypothetical protein
MPSREPVRALVLAAMLAGLAGAAGARAETAQVPEWVPDKYVPFIYRSVDDRPSWQRALEYLDIPIGETGPSFALIAGVSKYPNIGGKAGDLWPARLDVEKMVAYLEREPESFNEIVVLMDEDMTAETLGYFLTQYFPRRLAESRRPRFLFAYSGHGITAANGRGYILTSRARSLDDRFEAISLATLRAQFQEIVDSGHQVLALINACYGVDFHRLSLAFGAETAALPQREGAHAITAGGAGELTWHDPGFGIGDGPKGSVFFEAVLAALDGRADKLPADGIITVGELETYLKTTVSRFTDEKQNPTGGDLVSTRSPGGFFFLDRNRQAEHGNAGTLDGSWWEGVSFGGAGAAEPDPATASAAPPSPASGASASRSDADALASPQTALAAMTLAGVDSSLAESELLGHLANRDYTPYPAILEALLATIGNGRLKRPVHLDVIVWIYENGQNPPASPRSVAEVDVARLKQAVLAGFNYRYGTGETNYSDIVAAAP